MCVVAFLLGLVGMGFLIWRLFEFKILILVLVHSNCELGGLPVGSQGAIVPVGRKAQPLRWGDHFGFHWGICACRINYVIQLL
jgi:hypothetical protein